MAVQRVDDTASPGDAFARPDRINDAAQLIGHGMARPLVALRLRQARLEAVRAELRFGADHPETARRVAQADALGGLATGIDGEIVRQSLPKPDVGDQAGLYGRITRDGAPVPGVAVYALGEKGDAIVHSCTGTDGGYLLSFPPDELVTIEIRDDGKTLFRDPTPFPYPAFRATHRDIELAGGKPLCPRDDAQEQGGQIGVPALIGMEVAKATKELAKLGLKTGKRSEQEGEKPDIVVGQHPPAGTTVTPGSPVDLVISVKSAPRVKTDDLTGKTLQQAVDTVVKSSAELGAVRISGDGGKTARVTAAEPDVTGKAIDLHVSAAPDDDTQMTAIIALVLATTPEAAELALSNRTKTADWLKKHDLTSLDKLGGALDLEDDALRDVLGLDLRHPIDLGRRLLRAAIDRIEKL